MPGIRLFGRLRQLLTVLGVLAAMLLVPVSAVHGHDVLTGTSPEDGQTVEDMPQVVGLTFSNNPITLGFEVLVQDAGGQNWAAGDVEIMDNVVTQPISPEAPAGK